MGVRNRLLQFVDYKGLSKNKFYKETMLSNGFLDKNNHIGSDKIERIIYTYPELNLYWLITGEGDMLVSKQKDSYFMEDSTPYIPSNHLNENYDYLVSELRKKDVLIAELKEKIRELGKN
jgi:hypothetical protein